MSFEHSEPVDAALYITSPGNPLVKELHKLATDVQQAPSLDELSAPLTTLQDYLKDIQ